MSEPQPEEGDEALRSAYKATRKSLIERSTTGRNQKSWDEFYQTYWRLIYSVALKAGLRSEEAFDAVQETILCIAKQQKEGKYDPAQGSFKAWLMNMTRWRITDQFRKRKKDTAMSAATRARIRAGAPRRSTGSRILLARAGEGVGCRVGEEPDRPGAGQGEGQSLAEAVSDF